ncbi:helix-turn-helix transcriptional regulator [Paraburkholderia sp. MMS20-SJTR3]|uniref:Helix-turn-helix transcriptional regulator n=1 Tax=Paraburkholderia sejongensis TaxID=2886946 RepID=A0ABS8JZL3_9BURK|nr:helix-turn-helix transcriptional regulator [Paraburkholderia sp. MMS20-SJTR3]MCC8395342.1 helix-turn-helix transcriptional regulator [Paraburkholderia sp. MMS20-SJTR3]
MKEAFDPDSTDRAVFVVSERHPALDEPWRANRRARLIHVSDGVLTVRTEAGRWVVPPGRALWLVADTLHSSHAKRGVRFYSLYVAMDLAAGRGFDVDSLPARTGALIPDALTLALLSAAADFSPGHSLDEPARRLLQVLLDRIAILPRAALGLNWPRDPRIQRIADSLGNNPAQTLVLEELAAAAGVTARTAARLFARETGQTFGQWRQQLRLLAALGHLGAGESVSQVAVAVGYSDVSSFIAVFREAFGETPARYFR